VLSRDRISELRRSLPAEMLGAMVEECLTDLRARLPELQRLIAAGERQQVVSEAHAMVGMAAGYGMAALEQHLRALMQAARSGDGATVTAGAALLDAELSRAATALREALVPALV